MTDKTPLSPAVSESISQTADDFVQAGWRCYAESSYPEAEAEFRKAVDLDVDRADAYYGLAMTFLRSGRNLEGMELLHKAKAVNSENADTPESHHRTMLGLVIDSQIAVLDKHKGAGN